jgi:hypothetical protein
MQDKLRKLEDELDAHDDAHAAGGTRERRRLTCRDADEAEDRKISESRTRTKILDEIDQLLDKYGKDRCFWNHYNLTSSRLPGTESSENCCTQ